MPQIDWTGTPAVAGAYGALILLALIVSWRTPGLRESLLRQRLGEVREIRQGSIGLAVSLMYSLAAWASLPAGVLHRLWIGDRHGQAMRKRIDIWVLTWLAMTLALLLSGMAGERPLLTLLPILRITDITYTLLLVLVFPRISTSPSPARPLILLIIHLTELAISFAVFYQVACAAGNLKVDGIVCSGTILRGRDAFYFSLVTAGTIGFGDVTPLGGARWITVSQILLSLFLTLISIPRVFNNYPAGPGAEPKAALRSVVPLIPTGGSLVEALTFYTQLMGFSVVWQDGSMAGIARGGIAFNLVENGNRAWADNASFSIGVSDLEALYEEYRHIPANVGPLETKAWGRREFHMIVPSGVCLQFFQEEEASRPHA